LKKSKRAEKESAEKKPAEKELVDEESVFSEPTPDKNQICFGWCIEHGVWFGRISRALLLIGYTKVT
jgi:hypothetical protein